MTPAARVQAAIEILELMLTGVPVEKALTGWARRSRFAGSKDRAAVRDHVFDVLRCKRSYAAIGGSMSARGLMLGAVRASGNDPTLLFTGERHAPEKVNENEVGRRFESVAEEYDVPDWLWPVFERSLGSNAKPTAAALRKRAPVHLRVNLAKSDVVQALALLRDDGISAIKHSACDTALEVVEGARRISQSRAYLDGLVELQDAASQAIVAALDLQPGMRVLDYCAGGGGKALAIAARTGIRVFAHDADPARMRDLPVRAKRAGVHITMLDSDRLDQSEPFDVVLTDAPCSGSGSWRRAPAGKWNLTPERLAQLSCIQSSIIDKASALVRETGVLAYATCSMLDVENDHVVDQFLKAHCEWTLRFSKLWQVTHGTDGFYTAHLTRL
ncbi:MAG: RsmB/NOP family class I SAM-dependent RNA methyltransferase [Ruegeria sp.]